MVMSEKISPQCAVCSVKVMALPVAKWHKPDFCSNRNYRETIEKAVKEYNKPENRDFAEMVSTQETECYANRHVNPYTLHPVKPRVQEIYEFVEKMGCKKLGIAFCGGLQSAARALSDIFNFPLTLASI